MKDRLKRILIVGAGGALGGFLLGIFWRQHFSIVGISLVSGFVGLGFGIASELTRKRNELIRVIVRTLSCVGVLYVLFWLFYFLENLPFIFQGLNIEIPGFVGHLAEIIYKAHPIFILVVFGISITEELSKGRNLLIRITAGIVCSAFFCGFIGLPYSFKISWEELYQGSLYGASIALGLIIGVIISEKIGREKL